MKLLQIFASLVVAVSGRPDASHLISDSYLPAHEEPCETPSISKDPIDYHQVEDQKQVYFYASPNDGYYTNFHVNVIPKAKKNTKVIFIKTPHHAGVIPKVVAPPSLALDKTLVYVLVKKPVDGQSVSIPANFGVKQTKPEVFFIKYKYKHEAAGQVNSGIQGQSVGTQVPELSNAHDFVNVLGNNHGHHYLHEPKPIATEDVHTNVGNDDPLPHVQIGNEVFHGLEKDNVPEIPSAGFIDSLDLEDDEGNTVFIDKAAENIEPDTAVITTDDDNKKEDGIGLIITDSHDNGENK